MGWHAKLALDYRFDPQRQRTVARSSHSGPLRVLQSLYPEGDAVCHNVLIHPPGGLVGGDVLDIELHAGASSHALVTTPGATRFYRTEGQVAVQRTHLVLEPGARLDWLPLEAICFNACRAENHLRIDLAPGAQMLGWDVIALGLPGAGQAFEAGSLLQHIEMPGIWLERGRIDATDTRLLESPLGLAGQRSLATLFLLSGEPLPPTQRDALLDSARALCDASPLQGSSGATSPHAQVVVLRALAPVVEPAMNLLREVWQAWRAQLWQMPRGMPRIWAT
ncbi:urease accessory protein UreD [Variovorax dokdonensis]|uniref:Urease accessory protein UreD n=1 Tax=Variovorax dokdonensis TaxID=344883 RepID=A0ABT7NDY8_9BURK|nr:urease accessory protein UreD [Variovorax dokdonensis]MDM0046075.1 urease accessory protein UreD [Variovorax dokdonensis]